MKDECWYCYANNIMKKIWRQASVPENKVSIRQLKISNADIDYAINNFLLHMYLYNKLVWGIVLHMLWKPVGCVCVYIS